MPLAKYNLQLDQFTDTVLPFTWTAGGAPVNLTGCTARAMIRVSSGDVSPLLSITTTATAAGSIVLGGAAGTITVTISKAAYSVPVPWGAQWDLLIDWPNGTTTEFVQGTVLVNPTNTH